MNLEDRNDNERRITMERLSYLILLCFNKFHSEIFWFFKNASSRRIIVFMLKSIQKGVNFAEAGPNTVAFVVLSARSVLSWLFLSVRNCPHYALLLFYFWGEHSWAAPTFDYTFIARTRPPFSMKPSARIESVPYARSKNRFVDDEPSSAI